MLHSQARKLLQVIEDKGFPPIETLGPVAARAAPSRCGWSAPSAAGPASCCRGWSTTTVGAGWMGPELHDLYIGDPAQDLDWRASPLLHPDLSRLPPAFVLTAGYDPLRDEGLQYAQALTDAGSQSTLVCFERQIHGFITMGKLLDEANVAVSLCASQLPLALH